MLTREPTLLPECYQVIDVPMILNSHKIYKNISVEIPIQYKYDVIINTQQKSMQFIITFNEKSKRPILIRIYS
jgi:hypothetical protein